MTRFGEAPSVDQGFAPFLRALREGDGSTQASESPERRGIVVPDFEDEELPDGAEVLRVPLEDVRAAQADLDDAKQKPGEEVNGENHG